MKSHLSYLTSYLIIAALGVAFYLMCAANPLRWDDLMYQYMWMDHRDSMLLHPVDLSDRVDSFGEAFVSQCHHYMVMNGRFIVHFITQCFCGFLGKPFFNVLNALVYVLFLVLSVRYVKASTLSAALLTVAALWFGLPGQWILSFDVVFPINYLWSATACIAFLLLLRHVMRGEAAASQDSFSKSQALNFLLLLFAVCCGNMHEGYSLPISGALFFYTLFHYKSFSRTAWLLIVGFWIGTLIVAFAPGTLNRASGATPESFQEFLSRKMDVVRYSKRLYLLVAAAGIGWFLLGKSLFKQFLAENAIPLLAAVFGYLFLFALPYYSQRMGFPMDLFSVLVLIRLLVFTIQNTRLSGQKSLLAAFAAVLLILLAVHVPMTVTTAQDVGDEYREMLTEYQESFSGKTRFRNVTVPRFCNGYVYRLGIPFEQGLISFTMQKEMIIEE